MKKLTPAQREQRRKYRQEWIKNNPEKFKAYQAKYRDNNREAVNERARDWTKRNPNYGKQHYVDNKDVYVERGKTSYRKNKAQTPWVLLYRIAKGRAKKANIPFNITPEHLKEIWTDVCPVLNIPLHPNTSTSSRGIPHDNSHTVDRLVPELGYVMGNVKIVSYRANMIKNCGNADEHRKIADYIDAHQSSITQTASL